MCSMIPLDCAKGMLGQTHSFFKLVNIFFNTEDNFCFCMVFAVKSVVERIYWDIFRYWVQLLLYISVDPYRYKFDVRPKAHWFVCFWIGASVIALSAGILADVYGVFAFFLCLLKYVTHWAGYSAIFIKSKAAQLEQSLKFYFNCRVLITFGQYTCFNAFLYTFRFCGISNFFSYFSFFIVYIVEYFSLIIFKTTLGIILFIIQASISGLLS